MTTLQPFSAVLVFSGLAALTAALGTVPYAFGRRPSRAAIGWANALAGGLMLGVAYTVLTEGLFDRLVAGGLGTLLGIAFVRSSHALTGTAELDAERLEEPDADGASKAVLLEALHAADEGIAIGVAMAISVPLGIVMAATLAVHNIPEGVVLTSILTRRGANLSGAAAVAVGVNLNQVLLAALSFGVLGPLPGLLPWVAGFAVGTLMYRTLVELIPEAYQQAGERSIALVTLLAMGVVVLLAGVVE